MSQYTGGNHPVYAAGAGVIPHTVTLTAATVTTAGAVASIANPLGVDLIIIDVFVNISTAASNAANTLDIGVAANGTTSSDTLLDGLAAAAGLHDARNDTTNGTNGGAARRWGASQYVTATAGATLAGMAATLHLVCIRA